MNERGSTESSRWFSELDIHAASTAIVGGAAVLSFTSSRELADACGFHDGLSWVWPICLDAVAYVSTRIWLSRSTDDTTRLYARRLALTSIALSLTANGLELFLSQAHLTPVWFVVLIVGAVPPAMLAAVVHMLVMRRGLHTTKVAKKTASPPRPKAAPKTVTPEPEAVTELATVTEMSGDAPDWLTPDTDLPTAVERYIRENPTAKPADVQLHIGRHLGAKTDTTRKAVGRARQRIDSDSRRVVGKE